GESARTPTASTEPAGPPAPAPARPFPKAPMTTRRVLLLALTGILAGFFSGLFGVGGGIVIVPLLVILLHYQQRRASGTSLSAILPTAIAGSLGYASNGDVDWVVAGYLAAGAIVGSLIGTAL